VETNTESAFCRSDTMLGMSNYDSQGAKGQYMYRCG
jgi:hypothetical protein